jgi:hypothetical protein
MAMKSKTLLPLETWKEIFSTVAITTKDLGSLRSLYSVGLFDEETPLVLDNDTAFLYDKHGGKVFEMHPEALLREALKLLGIPYVEA